MGLIDRLSDGFGRLGKAAGQALDETRLQMDIMRARKRKDGLARDLGYLVFRVSQGATAIPGEQEALVTRITDVEKEIDGLERKIRELRQQQGGATAKPPEAPGSTPPQPPPATAGPDGTEAPASQGASTSETGASGEPRQQG
jgi:hypothetical protein